MNHGPWYKTLITERNNMTKAKTLKPETETEYLEALNKATNGELVRNLWN
jgi:hypothetical protein